MTIQIPKRKLDKVDEIALHHGFRLAEIQPVESNIDFLHPEVKGIVAKSAKDFKSEIKRVDEGEEPILIYQDKPFLINKDNSSQKKMRSLGFDIFGVQHSIAEAMIIHTAIKILEEEGYQNYYVDINSVGDEESLERFNQEIENYYKKHLVSLDNVCRKTIIKKNPICWNCEHERCRNVVDNAPKPIEFLSEHSSKHFKEVVEYLEEMGVSYRINGSLVMEKNHFSKTIFEIKMEEALKDGSINEVVLARGGRYDELASRMARKKAMTAVGLAMQFKKLRSDNNAYANKINKPKILLVQFGFTAKLRSFKLIEMLRKEQVAVYHSLHKNKLSEQFRIARRMRIPYIIVIGHQEAVDNEVIFKNVADATQVIVKMDGLVQYLRKNSFI